jgi:hypothetical protein
LYQLAQQSVVGAGHSSTSSIPRIVDALSRFSASTHRQTSSPETPQNTGRGDRGRHQDEQQTPTRSHGGKADHRHEDSATNAFFGEDFVVTRLMIRRENRRFARNFAR